jgi:hypothetical protein
LDKSHLSFHSNYLLLALLKHHHEKINFGGETSPIFLLVMKMLQWSIAPSSLSWIQRRLKDEESLTKFKSLLQLYYSHYKHTEK